MSAYDDGVLLGRYVKKQRDAGEDPDVRTNIAHEARMRASESFKEFMRGLNDGLHAP